MFDEAAIPVSRFLHFVTAMLFPLGIFEAIHTSA